MLNTLVGILYLVLMIAVVIGILTLLKKFVFAKIRINKFIPLGIAVAGLLFQFFLRVDNIYVNAGITILVVVAFAWFLDIQQTGGPRKNAKKVVIKPKAKPNRIKNNK
ncbi:MULTISPECIES: hypothetical protein [Clostridium]|uniref:Uncharacterized protein n=1 Tax=Clostridium cibarium TaxID=2762247 RepID=A0ABR8PT87_9CLOT|nr:MULTISPECIES: hypothetical protein [Clostridium]MBD7911374.1 hypothetical protein [Clostridium cibarium]